MRTDWEAVKADYVTGVGTVKELAVKYNISESSVQKKMAAGKWAEHRQQYCKRVAEELQKSVADFAKNETLVSIKRMNLLAEKLMDRLELSIEQLERRMVSDKHKAKKVTYVARGAAIGKTERETVDETETLRFVQADVDRQGLKQLTSALLDVKNILNTDNLMPEKVDIDFGDAEDLAE